MNTSRCVYRYSWVVPLLIALYAQNVILLRVKMCVDRKLHNELYIYICARVDIRESTNQYEVISPPTSCVALKLF